MKNVIVASHKIGLIAFLVIIFTAINLASWLWPDYESAISYTWIAWWGVLAWLVWSFVAPLLLVKQVDLSPQAEKAFSDFEESIKRLELGRKSLAQHVETAQMHQRELMRLVVGFVEKANDLQAEQEKLRTRNLGTIAVYDSDFSSMLRVLGNNERESTLGEELGILKAYEDAMRREARGLHNRIMATRGLITQQQLKLARTKAEIPLLQMGYQLDQCLDRLPHLATSGNLLTSSKSAIRRYMSLPAEVE